ncbi:bifunctional adenosylcobinamide kinase/adenosylcobinamide-phosphate guanylyltransferase [Ruminococcus sp.]|uniref:bifunctional adenosylcobinamide kinase/adenosylcobinamide-phosphate guanylyltransferase n=1 Tax=Ruminococcus sp. TaxID=41978 RepID=UPI0025F41CBA|nr:bifunctional adenosylcobinamide kinase/adenosylcobinamide-phosphate guanylyltransferase [Ruminococcus sp.]MCR4640048.1 bifunctional adenosylcobinamide kinase/adenosylcobinamide-phosphate guanylyltransferase [Ruminococcus sp.]
MIMVTGGAYQGKLEYVCSRFGLKNTDIANGSTCDFDEVFSAKCIKSYHRFIARLIAQGVDCVQFTERLCAENKEAIIILDEIGCGIIPSEKSERKRREITGKCGCIIAKRSDEVIRVTCGLPVYIKGGGK